MLYENGTLAFNAGQGLSIAISGRSNGTYTYKVQACNDAGCSAFTADFSVSVLFPPGAPGAITAPFETGPSYTVAWGPAGGFVGRYELNESFNAGAWTNTSVTTTSQAFNAKPYGSYNYRVRACNASGCSGYVTSTVTVTVITGLSAFTDAPAVASSAPAQQWVGAVPGSAGSEGGAATYRIPIDVPPGRQGMQPEIALTYSSRNGNSIVGVGWSLSAVKSIYRCPRTLRQDGGARTVRHDSGDRLCFDGRRLVATTGAYWASGSEYRTEVDQYDRITLQNGSNLRSSYFQIEHKSGRISQFEPASQLAPYTYDPDTWYLTREYDRQGNCIIYNYNMKAYRGTDIDWELVSVAYTGQGDYTLRQCVTGADARSVTFNYGDREDKRTTYRYGVGSILSVRLASISTAVGSLPVRTYALGYHLSQATSRSLLESVALCAGAACGTDRLPPTVFAYQEDAPNFDFYHVQMNGTPLGAEWRTKLIGDLDGDGMRDAIFESDTGSKYLKLSTCGTAQSTTGQPLFLGVDQPWNNTSLFGEADMIGHGRVDVFGTSGAFLSFGSASCPNGVLTFSGTSTDYPMSSATAAEGIDYDGDGVIDVRYATATAEQILLHRRTDPTQWLPTSGESVAIGAPGPPTGLTPQRTQDINGDGLVDTVFDDDVNSNTVPTQVSLFTGLDALGNPLYSYNSLAGLGDNGGPPGSFKQYRWRRWIDVNGDGLPDIYDPPYVWINRGGPPGAVLFQRFPVSFAPGVVAPPTYRTLRAFAMDVDGDGRDELMVPDVRIYDACYSGGTLPTGEPKSFCGVEFDSSPGSSYSDYDRSVFRWNAYKFVEASDGSFTMALMPTNLWAPTNAPSLAQNDSNGDGTQDIYFRFRNNGGITYDPVAVPASAQGPYVSRNVARAPDLMTAVTRYATLAPATGAPDPQTAAVTSWKYQPLSQPTVPGCNMQNQPFYVAHLGERLDGYAFFTSSMWTVASLDESTGLGTASNRTCYRYQDAMLDLQGRGFQGFKVVVSEQQYASAAGEPAADPASAAVCGGAATCSVNNLRTTLEFFQTFPLTSKLSKVTVSTLQGQTLSQTAYWWDVQASGGVYAVSLTGKVEKRYDTAGSLPVSQVTSVFEVDQISGEPARTCVASSGQAPAPDATHDTVRIETRSLSNAPADIAVWWLAKETSRNTLSDFLPAGSASVLDGTCQLSGVSLPTGSCQRQTPSCPTLTTTAAAKVRTKSYQWNPDSVAQGSRRKLQQESLVVGAVTEEMTTYGYDSFGNLQSEQISARDVSNAAAYPPAGSGLIALPAITYGLSADGYFRSSETNSVGHTSTVSTDLATGLPTLRQSVQGGPVSRMAYDTLGRLLTTTTDGSPPVERRVLACAVGDCAIKRQTFQAGANPIKTEYLDRLGRTIAVGIEGFDGHEVLTKTDYNARGVRIAEHVPMSTGALPGAWDGALASQYMTQFSSIDALGRPGAKTVVRSGSSDLFVAGRATANLVTTYTYSPVATGVQTSIAVSTPTAASGSITMSRTYDPRGKLVQTVQQVAAPSAHAITANYGWDPEGNLTSIVDTAGNALRATYDNLGRKTRVDDPDRGSWLYTWDGLSRVRSQQDARGVQIYYQYDAIGRLERRFTQAPGDLQAALEANWQYDLNGQADTLGAMVGVLDGYRKDYKYDSLLRPWSITAHIPAGLNWTVHDLVVEYGYDHTYGRVKAIKYPSGEIAGLDYDSKGNPIGETPLAADGTPGPKPYRRVTAMSERGQVTIQGFANGITETNDYDASTGMPLHMNAYGLSDPQPAGCVASQLLAREVDYSYDQFLNVARQSKQFLLRDPTTKALQFSGCTPLGVTATEQYGYDELQRLLSASRSWTGMTPSPSTSLGDTYAYDDLGNITKKSDYADAYTYGNAGRTVGLAGPHAVSSVSVGGVPKASFAYDANGNLVSGDGRTITFDNLDRPVTVTMAGFTAQFRYAPDGNRYVQSTTGPASSQEYYFDKLYELVESAQAPTDRTYVNNAVMIVRTGSVRAVRYRHLDRLGSLDAVTKEDASEDPADAHGYDAFGKPRARDWQSSSDQLQPNIGSYTTERGFTGHEHLDSLYLIHMNGRVYDYRLGRFLSVDPIISNPANSQSINPYSYIGNNPLSGTDPTGYECEGKQPATGSHVCGSTITNSSSPGFINGDPAVPGLNRPMQKKSGAETQGAATKTGPTADNGNPAATAQTNTTPRYDGGSLAQPSSTTTPGDWARALERKTGELLSNADLNMGGASEGAILSKHVLPGLLFGWLHLGEGIAAATSDPTLTPLQRLIAAVSDVTLVAGAVLPRIGSGSAGTVYRGLAAEEEAAAGLVARAPTAGNSIASHVAGQRASQWISTTKSLEVATSRFGQNGIVAIDLSKVSGEVVDLSQGIPGLPPSYMLSRWAIGSQEVLIQGSVPAEAITVIK